MSRAVERQRQQWPHRVAQLSYEDAMAYIDQTLAEGEPADSPDDDSWHPDGMDQECRTCGERAGEHHWDKSCPVYGRDATGATDYDDLKGFNVTKFSRRTNRRLAFRCRLAMPAPTTLQLSNQPDYLGSHGMKVMQDDQGEWAFKQPKDKLQFTVPLEHAATSLQRQMGLEAPETHVIDHQGRPAVVSRWYPNSTQAFPQPPHLDELHPDDQMTIQKNHVLDWLIGNHDSHVGNWMRTEDGKLVSIDKGQAAKYFGHDRLDPHFHPNYYAREPIYNQLYRDHAKGRGQLHDPRTGELGAFVKQVQSIPDEHLKEMFRPYAEGAARSGLLANPDGDEDRNLGPRTLPANSPEHFLEALVQRKNNLHNDLGEYYDRMSPARQRVGATVIPTVKGPRRVYNAPDIASTLGVAPTTMANWMRKYPDRVPAPTHQIGGKAHWDDLQPWHDWMRVRPAPGRPRKNAPYTLHLQDSLDGPSMPAVPRSVVAPLGEDTLPQRRRQIKVSPEEDYMNWADMDNSLSAAELLRGLHSRPGPGEGANVLPRRAQRRRP